MPTATIQQSKSSIIRKSLGRMNVNEIKLMDLDDRRTVMVISGQMKHFLGKEFMTSKKGQPEGKFAVWRIK